jgi:hypothetical protein
MCPFGPTTTNSMPRTKRISSNDTSNPIGRNRSMRSFVDRLDDIANVIRSIAIGIELFALIQRFTSSAELNWSLTDGSSDERRRFISARHSSIGERPMLSTTRDEHSFAAVRMTLKSRCVSSLFIRPWRAIRYATRSLNNICPVDQQRATCTFSCDWTLLHSDWLASSRRVKSSNETFHHRMQM